MTTKPAQDLITVFEDSRRWRDFEPRSNDVIISTPAKSGTTWMQGIISSLLWPAGDAPGHRGERSPWLDSRAAPVEAVLALLAAQKHRRVIKTHSTADCIPIHRGCKYIVVYRDGRDALASWANHRAKMRPEIVAIMNEAAAVDGIEPIAPVWNRDMDDLFDEWLALSSPLAHLSSWWPLRGEPFVQFVHYADLTADLEGEMRRVAAYLGIEIPGGQWAQVIDRCGLAQMRAEAAVGGRMDLVFDGGAGAFFNQGGSGRGVEVLSPAQLRRYEVLVTEHLDADVADWLARGSLAIGARPGE